MARQSLFDVSFEYFLLILACLELWQTVPGCEAIQLETLTRGRSSIWDEELHRHRERRKRNTQCNAQFGGHTTCTLPDVTRYDTLGRRNSGLLVEVENQGWCGSCWAFAASHAFADLRAISSAMKGESLSSEYATKCVQTDTGNGCCGGYPENAAKYFKDMGTVPNQCLPYSLAIYVKEDQPKPLTCPMSCNDGSSLNLENIRLVDYYHNYSGADDDTIIRQLSSGPVVVGMSVQFPFMDYRCGIYCHETDYSEDVCARGDFPCKHAVEIVDYGTSDTGVDFWVIKNSWGRNWGEDGYIRIRRGDLCIGKYLVVFFYAYLNSPGANNSQYTSNSVPACSEELISHPANDTAAKSAADFGIKELVRFKVIPCPDGSSVTNLTDISISKATQQMVNGLYVRIEVSADRVGCQSDAVTIFIGMEVHIDSDGYFSLYKYYPIQNSNKSGIVGYSLAEMFIALLIFLCSMLCTS